MRRLAKIALREYLAYVRTVGFWLSLLVLPLGLATFAAAPALMARSAPIPILEVVDLSGLDLTPEIARAVAARQGAGKPLARIVPVIGDPATAAARARDRLSGPAGPGALDAVAIIRPAGASAAIDFWSRSVGDRALEDAVGQAVEKGVRRARLRAAGVSAPEIDRIEALAPFVADFSPKAETGRVALKDRLPGIAGFAMGMLLWMVIFTGAGMLLTSVIEEKSSKILEVLLSSASVPEIMIGKILGVAAVTATVLVFWLAIAGAIVAYRFPQAAADLEGLLVGKGLVVYFAAYFVAGYLMFATFYVTVGASCESVREAQTLLGPVMILMSVPMVFMSQALSHPDAPLLRALEWIPPFSPFIMAARAGSAPPLAEVAGTLALIASVIAFEFWIAIPAFKSGALASGRFELRRFVSGLARRST